MFYITHKISKGTAIHYLDSFYLDNVCYDVCDSDTHNCMYLDIRSLAISVAWGIEIKGVSLDGTMIMIEEYIPPELLKLHLFGNKEAIIQSSEGYIQAIVDKFAKTDRLVIPNGVEHICRLCTSIDFMFKEVVIPNSVTKIDANVFKNFVNLEEIEIPDSVELLFSSVFAGCKNLKSIRLPNGITRLKQNLFADCTSLKYVEVPDSVIVIEAGAFYNSGVEIVKLPRGIRTINKAAFMCCYNLEKVLVHIDSKVTIPDNIRFKLEVYK